MISVYTTAFNIVKGGFDLSSALKNFSLVGDEIVIGTLKNEDNTLEILKGFSDFYPIKIVETDYDIRTFAVDGKLKDAALQSCSGEFCIQLDADERVGNPDVWNDLISPESNLKQVFIESDALMLPVIDLYRDINSYKGINRKWYIHKRVSVLWGKLHRGVVGFARLADGKFDKEKSDGCELLYADATLATSAAFRQLETVEELDTAGIPFVVHLGYLDLARRDELNNRFWKETWASYGGGVPTSKPEQAQALPNLRYTSLDFSNLI